MFGGKCVHVCGFFYKADLTIYNLHRNAEDQLIAMLINKW